MKIEIWSDFVCPFCYIGKRRLEQALERFPHKESMHIEYKSYQLHPEAEHVPGKSFYESFTELKGIPEKQLREMNQQLLQQAKELGLDYNFEDMKYANTFDAHRIAKFAETKGKGNEMTERLLRAYFTDSELLSDKDVLVRLSVDVGLDREEAENVLASSKYRAKVEEDIAVAGQIGVQGVPFFVFMEKYAVSGAQPVEVFAEVLQKVWEEENAKPKLKSLNPSKSETSYCTGDACDTD